MSNGDTNNLCLKAKHNDRNDENNPLPSGLLQTVENMFLLSEVRVEARFHDQHAAITNRLLTTVKAMHRDVKAMHRDVRSMSYPLDGASSRIASLCHRFRRPRGTLQQQEMRVYVGSIFRTDEAADCRCLALSSDYAYALLCFEL
jgi:hypothetical protein